jgi:lysophospholipase L1-like esterase
VLKTILLLLLPVALWGQARVLLIGDSISAGYEPEVRKQLAGKAEVTRFGPVGGPTTAAIENWSKLNGKWDVIHFNWGLHDIKLNPDGTHQVPIGQYERNLRDLLTRLQSTGAKLIWATTTPVPDGKQGPMRKRGDEVAYNAVARKIMDAGGVAIDDLYSVALSRVAEIQRPNNVHYTDAGYAFLAEQVVGAILRRLPETEARLKNRLEWFQDLKFGFMMHWGAYSQMGCIESWPLVWADRKWGNPSIQTREEMTDFRKRYFALAGTFRPVAFDPRAWAAAAQDAGMKYVVFTTKHHDGFSMFDTKQTGYKAPGNITHQVFDAFRSRGFGIGAYFSKPDWHHPDYWSPETFPEDRNPNYDTLAQPEKWNRFRDFVHGQIRELVTGYGPIDILWLDGGQVRPPKQWLPKEAASGADWFVLVSDTRPVSVSSPLMHLDAGGEAGRGAN